MSGTAGAVRIAVVGAGLGGLTVAGLLQRQGAEVTVYEQAASFSRIGAGIILSANCMKVLRALGLDAAIRRTGICPDAFVSRDIATGETSYELRFDAAAEARFGGPFVNIHRADLHDILRTALHPGSVAFNRRLAGLEERGDRVRLVFDGGTAAEADLVIGADGIHSRVRAAVIGPEPPRFTGRIAQRTIFAPERIQGSAIRDCTKWWGPDRHLLAYFMTSRRDEVYLMASVPAERWDGDDSSVPGDRDAFIAGFDGCHPDLRRVVEAAVSVMEWPILDRERDDRWEHGRIVLTGDACHPVRPYMAAGGAMAIEDAAILARCLAAGGDLPQALRRYVALRVPRVAEVQRISMENSWMRGPTEVDWFFTYDPCRTPLAQAA